MEKFYVKILFMVTLANVNVTGSWNEPSQIMSMSNPIPWIPHFLARS